MGERRLGGGRVSAWLRGRAADVAMWALCTAVIAIELDGVRTSPMAEIVGMAALLAVAFGIRRARPFAALGLAAGAIVVHAAATALTPADTFVLSYVLPCVALAFLAGRRSERTVPVVVLVVAAAVALLVSHAVVWIRIGDARETLTGVTDWFGAVAVLVAAVIAPWLLGRYWSRHAELRTAGWEIADRMERARDVDAERARLRERARIAGEMHDSLGHDLALIGVRAASLEMAAGDSEQRDAAAELRTAAHEANLRLREIIGVLREDAGPTAAALTDEGVAALVERAADAGLTVRLVREGPDPDPATPAGRASHRVVQEALTNAARHAPGAQVVVRLVRESGATEVRVADSGEGVPGAGADGMGNGSGLAGLRALVEGMGGTFAAGAGDDRAAARGFTVVAWIPDDAVLAAGVDGATETVRRLTGVRRNARRRLAAALLVPAGLAAAIVAVGFVPLWYVGSNTVLPRTDYAQLRVGDDQAAVERRLPRFDYDPGELVDPPPVPNGASCRYYLVEWENGLPPVFRLCFADGRLVAKARIARE